MIDKIALLYIKDGRVLSSLSKGKNKYYFPGGKREAGESDLETLKWEIKEELSVDIIDSTVEYYGTFQAQAHGHAEGMIVKMTCYTAEFTGKLKPDNEIEKIVWLTSADMEDVSPVDKIIIKDLQDKGLIE